jgi:hypothetical protein
VTKARLKNDADLYKEKIVIEATEKLLKLKFNSSKPEEPIIITVKDMENINPEITFLSNNFYFLSCLTSGFSDFFVTRITMRTIGRDSIQFKFS